MSPRRSGRLAITLLALTFAVPTGFAQKTKPNDQQDPSEKPRNVKPEIKKAYKDWLEKDVAYIITDEERKAFKKLETDDERERFIEEFWRRRDPDPDTDENEYREEYYERIAYANEHYASGIPGWKTDRGRIYIMYGKPDETETHPSGGAYNRESYEGGGSTSTYPFERWFYRYLPGVGSGIEIEFVDLILRHKLVDLNSALAFKRDRFELFRIDIDVLAFADFVAFDDISGLDFIAGLSIDLAIFNAIAGVLVDLMKADLFSL